MKFPCIRWCSVYYNSRQECLTVGCVPSACWPSAYRGGGSAIGRLPIGGSVSAYRKRGSDYKGSLPIEEGTTCPVALRTDKPQCKTLLSFVGGKNLDRWWRRSGQSGREISICLSSAKGNSFAYIGHRNRRGIDLGTSLCTQFTDYSNFYILSLFNNTHFVQLWTARQILEQHEKP